VANPEELLYSKEHEWARIDGDIAVIGITDYAQRSLGDIVYVELPKPGTRVSQFGSIGVVESVKAVSDLFTPLSGVVAEINAALEGDPAAVNRNPYGEGWLLKLTLSDLGEAKSLLPASEYEKIAAE
jgi:glycine cleavage system H protein